MYVYRRSENKPARNQRIERADLNFLLAVIKDSLKLLLREKLIIGRSTKIF